MKSNKFLFLLSTFISALFIGASASTLANDKGVERWRVAELTFQSATDYSTTGAASVEMDVAFTHIATGTVISRPAFWDGNSTFKVRFAPTLEGEWTWQTECRADAALTGKHGTLQCVPYTGNLDIYRHGFLKTEPGVKHLMYADGTPFFYLGATSRTAMPTQPQPIAMCFISTPTTHPQARCASHPTVSRRQKRATHHTLCSGTTPARATTFSRRSAMPTPTDG